MAIHPLEGVELKILARFQEKSSKPVAIEKIEDVAKENLASPDESHAHLLNGADPTSPDIQLVH